MGKNEQIILNLVTTWNSITTESKNILMFKISVVRPAAFGEEFSLSAHLFDRIQTLSLECFQFSEKEAEEFVREGACERIVDYILMAGISRMSESITKIPQDTSELEPLKSIDYSAFLGKPWPQTLLSEDIDK